MEIRVEGWAGGRVQVYFSKVMRLVSTNPVLLVKRDR